MSWRCRSPRCSRAARAGRLPAAGERRCPREDRPDGLSATRRRVLSCHGRDAAVVSARRGALPRHAPAAAHLRRAVPAAVRDLLGGPERRQFGVIAIRKGRETGIDGVHSLYEIGCIATLRRVDRHDDARFDIVTVGSRRFRLRGLDETRPYLQGEVEMPADEPVDPASAEPAVRVIQAAFRETWTRSPNGAAPWSGSTTCPTSRRCCLSSLRRHGHRPAGTAGAAGRVRHLAPLALQRASVTETAMLRTTTSRPARTSGTRRTALTELGPWAGG